MSKAQEVFWGSAYYFIGLVLAAGIAYLTKLVLVRNLTVEEYGLFFAVFTFVSFFTVFRSLGINSGLAKFLAGYNLKKQYGKIKSIIIGSALLQLVTSLIMVALMWMLAPWLANSYFGDEKATWLLRIVSLYLPLSIVFTNTKAILSGLKLNKLLAIAELVYNTLVLVIIVLALYLGATLYAPAYGYLIGLIIFFILFSLLITKNHSFNKNKTQHFIIENKKLLLFSLPLIFTAVGAVFITYFDTLLLTYFDTLAAVGVYNIIYPSAFILAIIGSAIGTILIPIVTELWNENKKQEINQALKTIYIYITTLCIPVIITLIVISKPAIRIFYGEEYVIGAVVFNILLVGVLFKILMTINYRTLIGLNESTNIMNIYIIGATSNVILNLILIPQYSLNGAAIATSTSFLIMLLISFFHLNKKGVISFPYLELLAISIIAFLIIVCPYIFIITFMQVNSYVSKFMVLILSTVLYFVILLFTRIISFKDIPFAK